MSKKGKIYLALIILAVAAVLFLIKASQDQTTAMPSPSVTPSPVASNLDMERGITVVSVKENQVVSSPLRISGFVSGNGWGTFEAQAGLVELIDAKGTFLALGKLETPGEWYNSPTFFETTLEFNVPSTKTGTLIFTNENASGLPEHNREYHLPVQFEDKDILK